MNKNVNAINDRFVNSFSAFMEDSMKYDENNLRTYLETRMNYFLILHNVGQAVLKGKSRIKARRIKPTERRFTIISRLR